MEKEKLTLQEMIEEISSNISCEQYRFVIHCFGNKTFNGYIAKLIKFDISNFIPKERIKTLKQFSNDDIYSCVYDFYNWFMNEYINED